MGGGQRCRSYRSVRQLLVPTAAVDISYTMYVYEGSMVTKDNKTEPYVVAVLKATSKTNV